MTRGTPRTVVLRTLLLLLLLGGAADLRWPGRAPPGLPVAVVDVSASTLATGEVPPEAEVAATRLLVADGVLEAVGTGEAAHLPRGASRLGEALRHAAARWPGRDVWLLSDGRDTDGDALGGAAAVATSGGRVFTSPPIRPVADLGWIEARAEGGGGSLVRVTGLLASTTDGEARVVLARGNVPVASLEIAVRAGDRRVVEVSDPDPLRGGSSYDLRLEPRAGTPDDDPRNDHLRVAVRPSRRTALVWGGLPPTLLRREDEAPLLVRGLPSPDPASVDTADVLVLSNLPWEEIGSGTCSQVLRFVAGGGRLLLLGGPRAYAAGGWAGTPLEEHLSALRVPRDDGRGRALLLAIDRSGSTATGALEALVRAGREALDLLSPAEQIAVLPFAATVSPSLVPPGWVSPGEVEARASLRRELGGLTAGGGTDLLAAIREAVRILARVPDVRERRVVLMTDGDPDHPPGIEALAALRPEVDAADVRFGALVAGDVEMADRLRTSLARDPEDVVVLRQAGEFPAALARTREAMRREAETLAGPATVRIAGSDGMGLDPRAYAPTRMHRLEVPPEGSLWAVARPAAAGSPDVPFGAVRRVGAGQVVSLAFGPEGERDAAAAAAWIAGLVLRLARESDRGTAADLDGDHVVVRFPEAAGRGGMSVVSEGGVGRLVERGPGLFRGPIPGGEPSGLRVVGEGDADGRALVLPVQPPLEHRGVGVDEPRLRRIAAAGGGRRLGPGEGPPRRPRPEGVPLAPWLFLAAGILLVLDRAAPGPRGRHAGPGASPR